MTCIIDEISSWNVIGSVNDDVPAGEQFKRVLRIESFLVFDDGQIRI